MLERCSNTLVFEHRRESKTAFAHRGLFRVPDRGYLRTIQRYPCKTGMSAHFQAHKCFKIRSKAQIARSFYDLKNYRNAIFQGPHKIPE